MFSVSVCLFVCLSVVCLCPLAVLKNHTSEFHQFSVYVTVAVARSSSDHDAIYHVLPVLWITLCFHTIENRPKSKTTHMFRPLRQVAAAVKL